MLRDKGIKKTGEIQMAKRTDFTTRRVFALPDLFF